MANDSIKIHIGAKDTASAVIQGVQARAVALGVTMGNLASKAIVGTINAFRSMVGAALDSEKASVRMDSALRSTGQYTPEAAKAMRELASAIKDETGASGAATKQTIAQLLSLGVTTSQMGVAARAVSALAAMGREGGLAMNAVARALNGDIKGFERFSPAVRNATTITEKYAAANQYLINGYEQQKANLNSVGGAWEALNGRLNEGRIKIIEAVFAGLRLGTTFNSMQDSVGRFLKSDTFANFTESLKKGAGYALDIAKAMAAPESSKQILGDISSVIVEAFRAGGDYVAGNIRAVFAETAVGKAAGWIGGKVAGAAQWLGRVTSGISSSPDIGGINPMYGAMGEQAKAQEKQLDTYTQAMPVKIELSRLNAALKKLRTDVDKQVAASGKQVSESADWAKEEGEYWDDQRRLQDQETAMSQGRALAEQKEAEIENKRVEVAEQTLRMEEEIRDVEKDIASAKRKEQRNQERLNKLAGETVGQYIKDRVDAVKSDREKARERGREDKRRAYLEAHDKAGNIRPGEAKELAQRRDFDKLRDAANNAMLQARKEAVAKEREQKALEAELKRYRAVQEKNLQKVADSIDKAMEAGN